jgi:hypothetical protein
MGAIVHIIEFSIDGYALTTLNETKKIMHF